MTLAQIIDALPLQVYVRRGELVIHFSTPADLVSRLAETSAALAELDASRPDGKVDRISKRAIGRPAASVRSESEFAGANDADQPTHTG